MYLGFESLTLRQSEKQVIGPAFCFGKNNRGIRTRREQAWLAEENSPADCFRRRGQGAQRREGTRQCAEKSLTLRQSEKQYRKVLLFFSLYKKYNKIFHDKTITLDFEEKLCYYNLK